MSGYEIQVNHLDETERLGIKLGQLLKADSVITLEGELGVGKTHLTKSIAKGLEVEEAVTSPTFTIIKEYEGRLPLYHIDAYRLEFAEEDLGLEEYFYKGGVSVIEWPQFIEDFLPERRLIIELEYIDETSRKIILKPHGEEYEVIVKQLLNED